MTTSTAQGGPARPAPEGITAEALRLFGSITRHLQGLAALAGVEGREAATLYLRILIVLGAALFFAAFGYVFVLLFVAFACDRLWHIDWLWISLGFAVLHLLGTAAGLLYIKKQSRTPIFRGTAEEIRKDVAAMRGNATPLI
ncbi:MAG TPA: phage holin family protein [Chthoniobacterales bacterium]